MYYIPLCEASFGRLRWRVMTLRRPTGKSPMEVDDEIDVPDPQTGIIHEMGDREPGSARALKGKTQASTLAANGLRSFTSRETEVKLGGTLGEEARANFPEAVTSRNVQTALRNKANRKKFAATYADELVTAKRKADSAARKEARKRA